MSFIRPEARTALTRWREAMIGGAIVLLGLWGVLASFGLMRWVSVAVIGLGLAYAWAGMQRARFRAGHGGLGVVQVDEGQITYLAPVGGGFAAIGALTRVEIAPDRAGLPVWRFHMGGESLSIPVSAEGTGALFDVLTALPGVDMETAIRASQSRPDAPVVIWRKTPGVKVVPEGYRLN